MSSVRSCENAGRGLHTAPRLTHTPAFQPPCIHPSLSQPRAPRSHRISTRITQAAAAHLAQIRAQHPATLAATLETLILQFPVESNNKPNTMQPTPS